MTAHALPFPFLPWVSEVGVAEGTHGGHNVGRKEGRKEGGDAVEGRKDVKCEMRLADRS